MKNARLLAFSSLLGCALSLTTFTVTPAQAEGIDSLSLSVGAYDPFDDNGSTDFRIEYRPGTPIVWELRPWLGAEVNSDGALYGAAGFLYDYSLGNQWFLTPSLGIGLYSDGSKGQDLGSTTEFRQQIEIGYQFENNSRVSGAVSHISNWGIGDSNPGADVFSLYYHIPMEWVKSGPGSN